MRNQLSQQDRNLLVGLKTGKYSGIAPNLTGLELVNEGQPLDLSDEAREDARIGMGVENTIACPMDERVCPDGSTVGRVPPDCEFAPCPKARKNYGGLLIILGMAALFVFLTIGKKMIKK